MKSVEMGNPKKHIKNLKYNFSKSRNGVIVEALEKELKDLKDFLFFQLVPNQYSKLYPLIESLLTKIDIYKDISKNKVGGLIPQFELEYRRILKDEIVSETRNLQSLLDEKLYTMKKAS